jgi:hypothetical protein
MEKDKGGDSVAAFDCCFHPEAIALGKNHKQFRDILVQTAISGIEDAFSRQQHKTVPTSKTCTFVCNFSFQVSLKKDFHVLKGVTYKSGQVPSMLIDVAGKSKWDNSKVTTTASTSDASHAQATTPKAVKNAIMEEKKVDATK